jgi:hypothetical protein
VVVAPSFLLFIASSFLPFFLSFFLSFFLGGNSMLHRITMFLVVGCLVGAQTYAADEWFVTVTGDGLETGTSWENAAVGLQSILSSVSSTDIIHVGAGTYKPTSGSSRSASFVIPVASLTIIGGYPAAGGDPVERRP